MLASFNYKRFGRFYRGEKMKIQFGLVVACVTLILGGCAASQPKPLYLTENAVGPQAGRVGIAIAQLPEADTHVRGATCLLCIAVAAAANSSLTSYAKTLPQDDLARIKDELAESLRKKGTEVLVMTEAINLDDLPDYASQAPNTAKKDFSRLRQKYNIDRVLVVQIKSLGFLRTYAGYIPTSPPRAMLEGAGYVVNLKNNAYEWYELVNIIQGTDANWDEPPKFPGLTNAYFQSLELARDRFLQPFKPVPTEEVRETPQQDSAK